MSAAALLISLAAVVGIVLLASAAPRLRRPRLANRLDPYLRGLQPRRSRLLEVAGDSQPLTPFPTVERLLGPMFEEGARQVERLLGGATAVARRLREAGQDDNVARFRTEQVLWALIGFLLGVVAGLAIPGVFGRRPSALAVVGGAGVGVLAGLLGRDWWLNQQVNRRQARMLSEFPTLADMICLAVTAGEAPRAAIERVVRRSEGEMSRELGTVLADLRGGMPFTAAMERLATRIPIPQVVRFVDGLVVAVERGTPLADVLRSQAADVREQRKRQLIEAGGKKEVYMLVPVVFLILPVVVLFALYPGLFSLTEIAR